jgi:hypothetical protein
MHMVLPSNLPFRGGAAARLRADLKPDRAVDKAPP